MPVSRTSKPTSTVPFWLATNTRATTSPRSVNFTALPTRLSRICRSRPASAHTTAGHRRRRRRSARSMPLVSAAAASSCVDVLHDRAQVDLRVVELEAARFHLGEVEHVVDHLEQRFGRAGRGLGVLVLRAVEVVLSSSVVIPITPFIGVRISWLMFARNSDLCSDAARASSRATAERRFRLPLPPLQPEQQRDAEAHEQPERDRDPHHGRADPRRGRVGLGTRQRGEHRPAERLDPRAHDAASSGGRCSRSRARPTGIDAAGAIASCATVRRSRRPPGRRREQDPVLVGDPEVHALFLRDALGDGLHLVERERDDEDRDALAGVAPSPARARRSRSS